MGFYPYNPNLGQRLQGDPGAPPTDMAFLAHWQGAPAAADTDAVHAPIALPDNGTLQVTDAITQPDLPRTLTITGNQAGISGDVIIEGTDAAGAAISETIAANGAATVEGVRAFATVTRITVPARNGAGDTISVGLGTKIGLPHRVYAPACLLVALFGGAADGGALTVHAELSRNVYAPAGALDGATVLDLFYIV